MTRLVEQREEGGKADSKEFDEIEKAEKKLMKMEQLAEAGMAGAGIEY